MMACLMLKSPKNLEGMSGEGDSLVFGSPFLEYLGRKQSITTKIIAVKSFIKLLDPIQL